MELLIMYLGVISEEEIPCLITINMVSKRDQETQIIGNENCIFSIYFLVKHIKWCLVITATERHH